MSRRRWLELALAFALLAAAAGFAVDGWPRESLPLGFAGLFVQIIWAASTIVDRIEQTPPIVVTPDLNPLDEGPRYYGG